MIRQRRGGGSFLGLAKRAASHLLQRMQDGDYRCHHRVVRAISDQLQRQRFFSVPGSTEIVGVGSPVHLPWDWLGIVSDPKHSNLNETQGGASICWRRTETELANIPSSDRAQCRSGWRSELLPASRMESASFKCGPTNSTLWDPSRTLRR